MQIKGRQRLAALEDLRDAFDTHQKRFQSGLTLDDYISPALGDQRRVAHKLQGIAQALLGMNEHALAMERFTSPHRLREFPLRPFEMAPLPSGFKQGPAVLEIAPKQEEKRGMPVGLA